MKKIVIVGAGGLGRELKWLIERINRNSRVWDLIGFVDDGIPQGTSVDGLEVLGGVDYLLKVSKCLDVVCGIAASTIRKNVVNRIKHNPKLEFPTIVDPSVIRSKKTKFGEGCVVCAGTLLTIDIEIGAFVIINPGNTIGHDSKIGDFGTLYPGCNISGNVTIGSMVEIGTGTQIIQGKRIGQSTIIGAGSVVISDLPPFCTAVGTPAKPIKFHKKDVDNDLLT